MTTITTECIVTIDVDQTLVMWGNVPKGHKAVAITNPHSKEQLYLTPHKPHIKILKERKARGAFIVVRSAGGFAWARSVVKALGLTQHVDLIMTKPTIYIDDKEAAQVLGERIYLKFDDSYGK